VTGRQRIDRLAELNFRIEEQLETPTYTDPAPTDSTIALVANKLANIATTNPVTLAPLANKLSNTATTNPVEVANTWRRLNPLADPLGSLKIDCYQPITNANATNITVGNKDSPGMESIFALQPTKWLHDANITWWCGYWWNRTGGISNYSVTRQNKRNQNKIDGERKTFFATPFFWKYLMDGKIQGANETKYVDIFRCSKILIPVNIKLKHWVLACINFDHKRISWYDSNRETHLQRSHVLFTWLKREHSFNRTTKFEPEKWSIDSGPPPDTRIPQQTNNYDCGVFVCLYAAFIDIQHPLFFSQHDINKVRVWMAHEMIEEGKLWNMICSALPYSNLATKTSNTTKRPGDLTTTAIIATATHDDAERQEDTKIQAPTIQPVDIANQAGRSVQHISTGLNATSGRRQPKRQPDTVLEREPKRIRRSYVEYEEPSRTAKPQGDLGTSTQYLGLAGVAHDKDEAQPPVERRERKKKKSGHTKRTQKQNNRATCRHDTYP
jgi:hypothetical protein